MDASGPYKNDPRAQWEAEMKELRERLAAAEKKVPKMSKMDPEDKKWHTLVLFLIVSAVAALMMISMADDGNGDKRTWSIIIPVCLGFVGYAIALLVKEYKD